MFIHDHLVLERKRSVLSKKGKKSIILRLEKGEKGTNFSAGGVRYLISATTRKRSRSLPTTYRPGMEGKSLRVAHDEQRTVKIYTIFFSKRFVKVLFHDYKQTCDTNLFCHCSMPECWDDMVQCEGFKTASEDEWLCIVCRLPDSRRLSDPSTVNDR